MCQQVTCRTCGKATWAGCGQHIDQALAGVPKSQRCQGHENDPKPEKKPGLFSRIFGGK